MDPYLAKLVGRASCEVDRDALILAEAAKRAAAEAVKLKKCEKGERTFYLIGGVLSAEQYRVLLMGMSEIRMAHASREQQEQRSFAAASSGGAL